MNTTKRLKLSYWMKYVLLWLGVITVSSSYNFNDTIAVIMAAILALEFFYQRYLHDEKTVVTEV